MAKVVVEMRVVLRRSAAVEEVKTESNLVAFGCGRRIPSTIVPLPLNRKK